MRLILTFSLLFVLAIGASAQDGLPKLDKSPLDVAYFPTRVAFRNFAKTEAEKNAQPVARVIYSRPQKNDRKIFGELVKYGEVWRLGANENTEIQLFEDVNVGDSRIKAGRYSLHATINESEWTVHFNTDLDVWGSYAYNEAHNVASITVPTEKTAEAVEAFTIAFKAVDGGAHLMMAWDNTMVQVPIKW